MEHNRTMLTVVLIAGLAVAGCGAYVIFGGNSDSIGYEEPDQTPKIQNNIESKTDVAKEAGEDTITGTPAGSQGNNDVVTKPKGAVPDSTDLSKKVASLVSRLNIAVSKNQTMSQNAIIDDLVKLGQDAIPLLEAQMSAEANPKVNTLLASAIERIKAKTQPE